eukprot:741780-Rhodomonas_salina.4
MQCTEADALYGGQLSQYIEQAQLPPDLGGTCTEDWFDQRGSERVEGLGFRSENGLLGGEGSGGVRGLGFSSGRGRHLGFLGLGFRTAGLWFRSKAVG